jgi:hypothetical protein
MGRIARIIQKKDIPEPLFNNRFTLELCENIHIHYRNLRIEMTKEEFLPLLKLLREVDEETIKRFDYNDFNFKYLINYNNLPSETFFNNRLQIERQIEGHYHLHYRNFRLEFKNIEEIGIKDSKLERLFLRLNRKYEQIKIKLIKRLFKQKKFVFKHSDFKIDDSYYNKYLLDKPYYYYKIKKEDIGHLKVSIFTKDGQYITNIENSPAYKFLNGDIGSYNSYNNFKKDISPDRHSQEQFERLVYDMDKNGYDENLLIIIRPTGEIIDGQHRVAYLYKKYGKKFKVNVMSIVF